MSYPRDDDPQFLEKLLERKELAQLKADPTRNFRNPPDEIRDPVLERVHRIHSHQLFVKNFMNPNTPYRKLHVGHTTGTGKTLAAISIANEFIRVYSKMFAVVSAKLQANKRNYPDIDRQTPSIFVLGFGGTRAAFLRDLMKYPEFGFISIVESEELAKRRRAMDSGLPDDIRAHKEFFSMIKKRITNKTKNGFFKFFGYDEFVNRLFIVDNIKLTDIEIEAQLARKSGKDITLEQLIHKYIADGSIQVNTALLSMFENSFVIADEVHNTYNMNMKNNRGVALQYLLDHVPSLRLLTLSATPINNSPTECVELINYLVPTADKVTKKQLFSGHQLLPGALELIGKITRGHISFLQDINPQYFPKRIIVGEELSVNGKVIPYLKFIRCNMSKFHQQTYNKLRRNIIQQTESAESAEKTNDENGIILEDSDDTTEKPTEKQAEKIAIEDIDIEDNLESSPNAVPTDGYAIYDIAFPNPDSTEYGLYKSSDIKNKIISASDDWRGDNKIFIKKYSAMNSLITGEFLTKNNIAKYSTKLYKLLEAIGEIMSQSREDSKQSPNFGQKIMIYHDRVKTAGVLLIQELLRLNGFLDEFSEPVQSTLCICGVPLNEHSVEQVKDHVFIPARFVMAHSDMDKSVMDTSLAKFNAADNAFGEKYLILVGSKIIKESFDFKDIQHMCIMSLPTNIPTLIQIFGRAIRKNSHINLPPHHRTVTIRIFVSTIDTSIDYDDPISPELYRYQDKLADYVVIQNIERELNRNAVDATVNRDIIMSPGQMAEYFPHGLDQPPVAHLGPLYYEPNIVDMVGDGRKDTTFKAYKYYQEEIAQITLLIKRLMTLMRVYKYADLWAAVRAPPFPIEFNPAMFDENNFIIALSNLTDNDIHPIIGNKKTQITTSYLLERLFDPADKYIYINGNRNQIMQIDEYYILFPVSDRESNPLNTQYTDYIENARDNTRILIKEAAMTVTTINQDVETYLRPYIPTSGGLIDVGKFIQSNVVGLNYQTKKQEMLVSMGYASQEARPARGYADSVGSKKEHQPLMTFLYDYSAAFQKQFCVEAIAYSFRTKKETSNSDEQKYSKLYADIIALLHSFGAIIYQREAKKYRDLAKQYTNANTWDDDQPVGFVDTRSVRMYDPDGNSGAGKWFEINKIAMNRQINYKENDTIIGVFETAEDHCKFKLRKPIQLITEDIKRHAPRQSETSHQIGVNDTRLIERGIVCNTKSKYDLLTIIASLGISVSKMDAKEIRIRSLCAIIRDKTIENEKKERNKKDSRVKWLYAWWDDVVDISARL